MNSVQELYFTDKDLVERWEQVKTDFWGDLKRETLLSVKRLLETGMDIEIQDLTSARRWQHVAKRANYRNGSYNRTLWTAYGWINSLKVPRVRSGGVKYSTFKRYQRRSGEVNKLVLEMFLAGVSTRRVEEVLKPIYGSKMISAATVSRISKELDTAVEKFHSRPITDDYEYLVMDGVYLKAKSPIKSKRRCILAVYGIKRDGTRELIDFKLARRGESQIAWECFLTSLYNRGLKGDKLKMTVMDGNKGLYNAVDVIWPDALRQHCWAHKLRNVANRLPKKLQTPCISHAQDIYQAENEWEAMNNFKAWAKAWRVIAPEAVACLEDDLEDMLCFYRCPKAMRKKLRTTNIIERIFREVRRRTRPISCFSNVGSVERIIFAIFNRQNNIWKEKPLKEITQNS